MSDRLADVFLTLTPRERFLAAFLTLAVIPIAIWFSVLSPLALQRIEAQQNFVEARNLHIWVQDRASEKSLLKQHLPTEPIGISGLERALINARLADNLAAMAEETDGSVLVEFSEVRFHAVVSWLEANHPEWGYNIASYTLTAVDTPGLVDVQLRLSPR